MRFRTLLLRSLRFHWRGHLGVLLGAAVGSAALIGALVVGDSVRLSLRGLALQRLGNVHFAMDVGDRHFRSGLAELIHSGFLGDRGWPVIQVPVTLSNRLASFTTTNWVTLQSRRKGPVEVFSRSNAFANVSALLKLDATAASQGGQARANRIQLFGVNATFGPLVNSAVFSNLPPDAVVLNEALARQLSVGTGDVVTIRTRKPDALGGDSPLAPQDETAVVLRLQVHRIISAAEGGNFNLTASQVPPFNAFVALPLLQENAGVSHRANLLVTDLPRRTWWEKARFTWVQWAGDRLRRMNVNWIRPSSPLHTKKLSSEEGLALLDSALNHYLSLSDLQLQVTAASSRNEIELRSSRVFLDQPVIDTVFAAVATNVHSAERLFGMKPYGVLTYLVNLLRHGDRSTPYSMVTAGSPPLVPADLGTNEIIINQWLADDLGAQPGSEIELSFFVPDRAAQLVEATNRFRVREVLPMDHPALDRTLMPDFPGVAGAEAAGDWETGFSLVHEIRPKDDEYWKAHRGTPKAFISLAAGQRLWSSRQGNLTAIRFPAPPGYDERHWYLHQMEVERALKRILTADSDASPVGGETSTARHLELDRASLGFRFQEVRAQALASAAQSQDFGQLFLGFSFFLIGAALILMALLFQFGIEQRTTEIGTLLALGFTPARVRWLLLGEGIAVAFIGGMIGVVGGVAYANAMLYGLATLWRDAVGASTLRFHATPTTLAIGLFASVVVCAITIWFVLRKQARRPARELLAHGGEENVPGATPKTPVRSRAGWIGLVCGSGAVFLIALAMFKGDSSSAGTFFGAGALLLVAELAAVSVLLRTLDRSEAGRQLSVSALGLRNCTRRRSRSLASVALLACGSFLVVAVGANRLDAARDALKRSSGTGGFALFGESTLPVVRDLNTKAGREFFNLDEEVMNGVSVVPFRVRDGDDASCLNLNRAQTPRLLGVNPELLAGRQAFTFAKVMKGLEAEGWRLLRTTSDTRHSTLGIPEIPAIGDAASIQWALGRKIGDTIEFTDERGRKFNVRLVAGVANSILQGNLIIDEAEFTKRFPGESGHRMFLIDTPSNTRTNAAEVSAALSRALQDVGLELTPTTQRLAAFNAVQNTYLNTFQVLGGLGLLLGSAGLGVVVLRNVLERRGELGVFQAVGFRRRTLRWLVLSEHAGLLWVGLAVGITAALAAVLPALLSPGAGVHYAALAATLAAVLISGLIWTWFATWLALRGRLLDALRNE
jgi:putative ABC transport system permease protein